MATKVIGKLDDWSDADVGGGNDFMNLDEGENVVRIISKPYQFYIAWTEDNSGQTRKIRSAVENCPLAQRGDKITARWYVGVINRKTQVPAILEIGTQILKQITGLKNKSRYGDPRGYDINIEKGPKGNNPLYVVIPDEKGPLTDDEKEMAKAFLDRIDLAKMSAPPSREEVLKMLGVAETKPAPAASKPSSSDDGDDFNFDNI